MAVRRKPFIPGEIRECPDCGIMFSAREEWMVRCIDCYYARKEGRTPGQGGRKAASDWQGATPPPPRVEVREVQVPDQDGKWLRDHLRQLLILCHPDKHGGTDLAHDITIYLTKRYREVKK